MNGWKHKLISLLGVTLLAVGCGTSIPKPIPSSTRVADPPFSDAILEGRRLLEAASKDRAAISVAVAVDGRIVWSEASGWASVDPDVAATTETRFRGYSVAKSVTGTLAVRLARSGAVDLDRPIATYLTGLPSQVGAITLRQLLGHLGGVRHYESGEWMRLADDHCERAAEAIEVFVNDPLDGVPGAEFRYSTFGFVLASAALEAATGVAWPELVRREIYEPAGMSRTSRDSPDEYGDDTATGYEWKRGLRDLPDIDNSCKFGAGSMLTTAEDLTRFGVAVLDGTLIDRESLDLLFTPQTTASGESTAYSLGWGVSEDGEQIGHSGGSPGGRAFLLVDRRNGVAVALTSSVEGERLNDTAAALQTVFAKRDR